MARVSDGKHRKRALSREGKLMIDTYGLTVRVAYRKVAVRFQHAEKVRGEDWGFLAYRCW